MCFRFEQEGEDIGALIYAIEESFPGLSVQDGLQTSPNIALTEEAMVLFESKFLRLQRMRFGLVPAWKKAADSTLGNARSDTVDQLPSFKDVFVKRRCLIPVTGFYEWRLDPGEKRKTPYKVTTLDEEVFYFAGLWDYWAQEKLLSFSILTTEPNELISQLHDRMPVILPKEEHGFWLDPKNEDGLALKALLRPYPAERMAYQAYDRYVSNARNKEKAMIAPVGERMTY